MMPGPHSKKLPTWFAPILTVGNQQNTHKKSPLLVACGLDGEVNVKKASGPQNNG
jgi:hypothetical protein